MAYAFNQGTASTAASYVVASVHHPAAMMEWGTATEAVQVGISSPMPVQLLSTSGVTVPVSGTVTATVPNPLTVSGTVTATVPNPTTVSGTVAVSNFPNPMTVSGTVSATVNVATVSGTVAVSNLLNPMPVSGTFSATVSISSVSITTISGVVPDFGPGAATTASWRVVISSNSPGVTTLGNTTKNASVPVTMASDQELTAGTSDSNSTATKIGYRAIAGMSGETLVDGNDRQNATGDLAGALFVRTMCGLEDIVSGTSASTVATTVRVIAAAGSGIKQYITSVALTNMDTSSAMVNVVLRSSDTARWTMPCPAGGAVKSFDPPLPPNAANEAWFFSASSAVAAGVTCSLLGFKSKI